LADAFVCRRVFSNISTELIKMQKENSNSKNINNRLEKLERQNRLFKRISVLFLIVACTMFLMGQKSDQPRTVEAERFILLDSKGKVRTELSVDDFGKPHLIVYDKEDRQRLRLGGSPTGPRIEIIDHTGKVIWKAPESE